MIPNDRTTHLLILRDATLVDLDEKEQPMVATLSQAEIDAELQQDAWRALVEENGDYSGMDRPGTARRGKSIPLMETQ